MSKQMSRRALKQLQYDLEDLSEHSQFKIEYHGDKGEQGQIQFYKEKIQVLEYFIEQVKAELKYLEENKE